jgi:hypothetical protein
MFAVCCDLRPPVMSPARLASFTQLATSASTSATVGGVVPLAFPLTAVPILALSIAAFMIFPSFYGPKGLRVHLVPTGASETKASSFEPIV